MKTIDHYKGDSNIVFLFIDVWESTPLNKLTEEVQLFMKENKYDFNVLFDEERKVVKEYRIESIPKKIIIDAKGSIVFIPDDVSYLEDISSAIEAARN